MSVVSQNAELLLLIVLEMRLSRFKQHEHKRRAICHSTLLRTSGDKLDRDDGKQRTPTDDRHHHTGGTTES